MKYLLIVLLLSGCVMGWDIPFYHPEYSYHSTRAECNENGGIWRHDTYYLFYNGWCEGEKPVKE